jgi:hypothetical protein
MAPVSFAWLGVYFRSRAQDAEDDSKQRAIHEEEVKEQGGVVI